MAAPRQKYELGAVVGVPVADDLWGVAVVARWNASRRGYKEVVLYGIDRQHRICPTMEEVGEITPCDALCLVFQGDRAIHEGLWPVIGYIAGWTPEQWPLPPHIGGRRPVWIDNPELDIISVPEGGLSSQLVSTLPRYSGTGNATWLAGVFNATWRRGFGHHRIPIDEQRLRAWQEASRLVAEALAVKKTRKRK